MFGPPDDPPPDDPSFDGDMGSPPGTPPDLDLDDMDFPPDDNDMPPPDMDDFDDADNPPMDGTPPKRGRVNSMDLPPIDEDGEEDLPPPDDAPPGSDDGFDDDIGAPPSGPPSVEGGDDDFDLPPPDDDGMQDGPPDSLDGVDPPPPDDDMSAPPPSDDDRSRASDAPASVLPTKIAPRKQSSATLPLSTRNRALSNSNPGLDSLSEGLTLTRQPSALLSSRGLRPSIDGSLAPQDIQRLKKISERQRTADTIAVASESEEPTLRSNGVENRPKLNRKARSGQVPSKLKKSGTSDWESDDVTISSVGTFSSVPVDIKSDKDKHTSDEFLSLLGHFEGDPFEELLVKVEGGTLYIKTVHDPDTVIAFDLRENAQVIKNVSEPNMFTLNHDGNVITFKAETEAAIKNFISKFPSNCLQNDSKESNNTVDTASEPRLSVNTIIPSFAPPSSAPPPRNTNPYYEHGFEELYNFGGNNTADSQLTEGDNKDSNVNKNSNSKKSSPNKFNNSSTILGGVHRLRKENSRGNQSPDTTVVRVKGYQRSELMETKLATPKYSVRRVKQLCKWISSLGIWPRPISIMTLHTELCSGVLLARIMKAVVPDCQFLHLSEKALTKKAAIDNIEQALGAIWRSKCVNNSRIPSSLEIFNGNTSKISVMIQEIFEVYVRKPLYQNAPKMFRWYNAILKQYSIPLPDEVFTEGDLGELWHHMQSGCAIFCVIYHMYGPALVGAGNDAIRVDSLRVVWKPENIADYRANLLYVFSLLRAINIPVLWDVEDWITYPDTEFIVLQLFYVFNVLQHKQCSLPPAQGTNAGVTSGPNGEPMVSGMVYADTRAVNSKAYQRKRRTVLLGTGEDALPVLPIDTSGDSQGLYREVCPLGLLSNNVKIVHAAYEVKGQRAVSERKQWNSSVMDIMVQNQFGSMQPDVLKMCNNSTPAAMSPQNKSIVTSAKKNDERSTPASFSAQSTTPVRKDQRADMSEIALAMEELETEMTLSQKEIDSLEDELVNRYTALEAKAGTMDPSDFNNRLNSLEKERMLLEEERYKLQEHFAMKLSSIKTLHEDAMQRTASNTTSFETPKKTAPTSTPKKKSSATKDAAAIQKAERGWNRFSNHATSYNFTFKKAATAGISPTSTGKLKSGTTLNNKAFLNEDIAKPSTDVNTMWNKFKTKMANDTATWAAVRAKKHSTKIQELAGSRPTKLYQTYTPVASNKIPIRRDESKLGDQDSTLNVSEMIRKEEMKLMLFEEKRRYIVMQEKLLVYTPSKPDQREKNNANPNTTNNSVQFSQSFTAAPPSPILFNKSNSYAAQSPAPPSSVFQKQQSLLSSTNRSNNAANGVSIASSPANNQLNKKSFDAMLTWMIFPRNLYLKDRHSQKEFVWTIENDFIDGHQCYTLKWEIPRSEGSAEHKSDSKITEGGSVFVQDIDCVSISPQDPSTLVASLSSKVRTLKSSGGRTTIALKFASEGECGKYKMGLDALKAQTQQ